MAPIRFLYALFASEKSSQVACALADFRFSINVLDYFSDSVTTTKGHYCRKAEEEIFRTNFN